ncbi:MAG: Gfo/Idh/MocA family oxidoreductase [Clostridia bacterium]|nr:Gfo/Idh/MocA family oxidoreductase [Clostridia bacterium]
MLKLATIGTSPICDSFLGGARLSGKFEHTAVYSRNYETGKAFAQKHGCKNVFTSLGQMASWDGIDCVYIASPNVFHAQQSKLFLENGKHVLCEKPIATSAKEYEELKLLADEKSLIYMEAIIPPHTSFHKPIKDALGKIGKISMVKIDFCQRSSKLDAYLAGENPNIFNMSLHAGALMDLGVYCVYAAIDLLGVPKSVSANASYLSNGADSGGVAVFEYDDFNAVLTYAKNGQSRIGSEIVGEECTLKIKSIGQYSGATIIDRSGNEIQISGSCSKEELMSGEAKTFANFILNPEQTCEEYASASKMCLDVHRCMDKIKHSANIVYPALNLWN